MTLIAEHEERLCHRLAAGRALADRQLRRGKSQLPTLSGIRVAPRSGAWLCLAAADCKDQYCRLHGLNGVEADSPILSAMRDASALQILPAVQYTIGCNNS